MTASVFVTESRGIRGQFEPVPLRFVRRKPPPVDHERGDQILSVWGTRQLSAKGNLCHESSYVPPSFLLGTVRAHDLVKLRKNFFVLEAVSFTRMHIIG